MVLGITTVVVERDDSLNADVRALGDKHRRVLGLLPHAAWDEYVDDRRVVAAVDQAGTLLGYVAYRLPRNEVVLAHVVTTPGARGKGVAKHLVDQVSAKYSSRRGVRATCRRDYAANQMWPKLGFVAVGDRPGRGRDGHRLTDWWLDHGHQDLMSWQGPSNDDLPVVLDCNVFIDMHEPQPSPDQVMTRDLLASLAGRIELLVTPEIHTEIDRASEPAVRQRHHDKARQYPEVTASASAVEAVMSQLKAGYSTNRPRAQTISDMRHIAYAACAGVPVVVTRDDRAVQQLGPLADDLAGIRLATPEQLVQIVDELENVSAYAPGALLGTGFFVAEVSHNDLADVTRTFLDKPRGERRRDLARTLDAVVSQRPNAGMRTVRRPEGTPAALLAYIHRAKECEVPALRVQEGALGASIAAQLVSMARLESLNHGGVIRITDQFLSPLLRNALLADGFKETPHGFLGFAVAGTLTLSQLANRLQDWRSIRGGAEATDPFVHALAPTEGQLDPAAALALEHELRPVRLPEVELPTWLVPIKPHWASELFGEPPQLYERSAELGMSLEHVYYRSDNSAGERAPGRVLWYASGKEGKVFACSSLQEVLSGPPDEVWRKFRRLGVWSRDNVRVAAGKTGKVRALRVADTYILDRGIPLRRLQQLAKDLEEPLNLAGPKSLSHSLTQALLAEGLQHTDSSH